MKTKLLKIKVALLSCYIEVYVDSVPFSEAFGYMAEFDPLVSAFEGHGPRPRLKRRCMCIPTEFKDDICTDYLPKVHANSNLHRQIISQIQTKHFGVGAEAV